MKSQDMFQNAYGDETFYLTTDEAVNFADTTKYIWKGGTKTILVNAAMVNTSYIRLPEATTDNAGLIVKVIYALSPAALHHVGFVTTLIVGGANTVGSATEGNAPTDAAMASSAVGTSNLRLDLDVNVVGKAGGHPGTELEFYYTGVANVVIFKGSMHADVDDSTLAALFSTTAVNA